MPDNPRKIRVYRNGDEYFTGKRIVVNERIFRNFEQVSLVWFRYWDIDLGILPLIIGI